MDSSSSPIVLFNTRFRRKEPFVPKDPLDVRVYCCGPTVYDKPHLGHARTFIFADVLCRCLRYFKNYNVRYVMNITDYDDKIISKGGLSIARKYEKIFFETMDRLNVQRPDFTPRASDFFDEAKTLVEILREKGYVSSSSNRFDTSLFQKEYGVIFPNTEKRNCPEEGFSVWKKDNKKCLGGGKPGWHMECATMNARYFGDRVDLHVGGVDLEFPHHENEIALGCVLFDKRQRDWVQCTLHTGHLEIDGRKMSKSEKNFITLEEGMSNIAAAATTPLAIRYLFLKHPYGSPMHFNEEEVVKAQKSYNKLISTLEELKFLSNREDDEEEEEEDSRKSFDDFREFRIKIGKCITDNLNTPEVIRTIEKYVKTLSKIENNNKSWLRYCLNYTFYVLDKYLGLLPHGTQEQIDSLIPLLKKFRTETRENALRQLKACDDLRKKLNSKGFVTEDKRTTT